MNNKIFDLIEHLRTCENLNSEEIHNLILDLEAIQGEIRGLDVRLHDARRMEKFYNEDSRKQLLAKVKYKEALEEIKQLLNKYSEGECMQSCGFDAPFETTIKFEADND